jgi:tetratricopeptide (TPR) repeat protein
MRIASLFPDDGAGLLADAGLPNTWEAVLEAVPAEVLAVDDLAPRDQGERLLILVREHFSQQGELRPALAITRALVRRRIAESGEEHPDTLGEVGALGALADRAGRSQEASDLLERAFQGLRSSAGGRDLRLAVVAQNLAWHYLRVQQPLKAEQTLEQALRIRRDVAPETTGPVAAQLAELMIRRGERPAAVPLLQEAWERYRDAYGPTDPRSVARAKTYAAILVGMDREAEAIPVLRVIHQATKEPEARATAAFELGMALESSGQREESFRLVEEALRWTRRAGDPHPELSNRLAAYSRMVIRRGRPQEAEGLLLEAVELDRRTHGDDSPEVAVRFASLGHLYAQMGRHAEAMGWLEPAASLLETQLGPQHPHTRLAVETLVQLWIDVGRNAYHRRDLPYARQMLAKAKGLAKPLLGEKHWLVAEIDKFGLV